MKNEECEWRVDPSVTAVTAPLVRAPRGLKHLAVEFWVVCWVAYNATPTSGG